MSQIEANVDPCGVRALGQCAVESAARHDGFDERVNDPTRIRSHFLKKISLADAIILLVRTDGANMTEVTRVMVAESRTGERFLTSSSGWDGCYRHKGMKDLMLGASERGCETPVKREARTTTIHQHSIVAEQHQGLVVPCDPPSV